MPVSFEEASTVLPSGLVSPDDWPRHTDWFPELDFERFMHEAALLPTMPGGRELLTCMSATAVIEDQTVYSYANLALAPGSLSEERREYIGGPWQWGEWTHGTVEHLILDAAAGLTVSERARRDRLAQANESRLHRVSTLAAVKVAAFVEPHAVEGVVDMKGLKNEPRAAFARAVMRQRLLAMNSQKDHPFKVLPLVASIIRREEHEHQENYYIELCRLLEENPKLIPIVRFALKKTIDRNIGDELLTPNQRAALKNMFDKSDDRHVAMVNAADIMFGKVPGMQDLCPFRASLGGDFIVTA